MKGAFTDAKTDRVGRFELADGGTLFLDEIGNMPLALQAKLLRVLQTGEFERVGSSQGAARGRARHLGHERGPAAARSREGRFREDLLFRLNTVEIHLPPLRERREDIPRARRALPPPPRGALSQAAHGLRRRRRCRRCSRIRGRATSASSITPWSAPC